MANGFIPAEALSLSTLFIILSIDYNISAGKIVISISASIIFAITALLLLKFAANHDYEKKLVKMTSQYYSEKREKEKLEKELEKLNEELEEKNAEISRINERMKESQDTIKDLKIKFEEYKKVKEYAKKLKEENETLKRELEKKEMKIEEIKEYMPGMYQEHFGDLDYWTGKRLYELRKKFPRMGYRKMEEMTGVTKSTIERRIKKYAGHLTDK